MTVDSYLSLGLFVAIVLTVVLIAVGSSTAALVVSSIAGAIGLFLMIYYNE